MVAAVAVTKMLVEVVLAVIVILPVILSQLQDMPLQLVNLDKETVMVLIHHQVLLLL